MAGFISKQPNGLYCRFSTVTDCPTAWDMTREDYINMKMREAKEDAEDVLDNYLKPFDMVVDMYYPNNMTKEEFDKFLEETGYDKEHENLMGGFNMKYRKKPVVIEAIQWTGLNLEEIKEFAGESLTYDIIDDAWELGKGRPHVFMKIKTLEGDMKVSKKDFIIKGVNGEVYPCKPDIFEKTYEEVLELGE